MPFPQPPFGSAIQAIVSGGATKVVAVWQNWLQLVQSYMSALTGSGPTSARPTKDLWVGQPFFDTTINVPVYWNGSTWVTSAPAGTVTNVTGTLPILSSGGTTPDISITQANASTNGYISASDWTAFNAKVSSVSGTSPIVSSGGVNPAISIPAANGSTNGYLTSTDWTTFNNKQPAGTYVNSVTATSPVTSTGGTTPVIAMPAANGSTNGYLTSADWTTFNSASNYRTYVNVALQYGTTSAAIQSAINANPNRTLYLQAGNWTINSQITIANPVTIIGDGTDSTLLLVSINTDIFTVTANGGCVFKDFAVGNLSSQLTGGSIFLFNGSSGNQRTIFDHVSFYNVYYGIRFTTSNIWIIRSCYFTIFNTAISISNTLNNDAGDSTITECIFDANSHTQGTAIYQDSSGGLRVINNKFLDGLYHYIGQYSTPINNTSIFVFVGNSSEGAATANLSFNTTSYPFQGINITGNQFSIGGSGFSTNYGIQFVGNQVSSVMIGSNEFNGTATGQVIYFGGGGSNITVGTNTFKGNGSGTAIGVGSGNPDIFFLPQQFDNYTTNYAGSSTGVRFGTGQSINGQITLSQTGTAFGGGFYTSGFQTVTFSPAFPQTPNVTVHINAAGGGSNTGGVFGLITANISSTGFQVGTVGVNSGGSCICIWQAWLTGQ